ncbi:MAG: hypothetical protein R2880_21325 [Deinococcales bacterium]
MPSQPLRMPGASLTTRLKVYDDLTPDGQRGGTPHMHRLCTEMYFVTAGAGAVEIIDMQGFRIVELELYDAFLFSPGTIHRLINANGNLELFIMMQNSGLPERGDNVVTFNQEFLGDDARYQAAMKAPSFEAARLRRDRGVEGFMQLKAAFAESLARGQEALADFYALANERTHVLRSTWQHIIETGAQDEVRRSFEHLEDLSRGDLSYLGQSRQHHIKPQDFKTAGFCGALNRYFDPATLELEGITQIKS